MLTTGRSTATLHLLGGFRFLVGSDSVELPFQARRLLSLLALESSFAPRTTIAGTLWSEVPGDTASSRLRTTLWRVRRAAPAVIESRNDLLALASSVDVDVHRARDYVRLLEQRAHRPHADDIRLLGRELLPDWDEDWLIINRERCRQDRLHALEFLTRWYLQQRRHSDAIAAALAAVAIEPLRETAQTALVQAHLAEGNASEAVRQYNVYRSVLRDELGLAPARELTRLIDEHRAGMLGD
jgi:DNA-binding SARP family transcriptional activator